MATGTPTIQSDIKPEHWAEVLESFLQLQIGKGADDSPATDKATYRIHLQLDISDGDQFFSSHDCGNKGLRDGILMGTLAQVRAGLVKPTVQGPPPEDGKVTPAL